MVPRLVPRVAEPRPNPSPIHACVATTWSSAICSGSWLPAAPAGRHPLALEVAESCRASEIRLDAFATALVDDFAPPGIAHVCRAGPIRHQVTAHVVDAFPEHNL